MMGKNTGATSSKNTPYTNVIFIIVDIIICVDKKFLCY